MSIGSEAKPPRTGRLKRALSSLGRGGGAAQAAAARDTSFRQMYERFREILGLNDAVLQVIADMEDKLQGRHPFAFDPLVQRIRRMTMDVFVMVKDLNQMAGNRYGTLYEALRRVSGEIDLEFASQQRPEFGPLILPLGRLRAGDVATAGAKMANLGEVMGEVGLRVPEGFVITAAAFQRFMSRNDLLERARQLEGILEMFGPRSLVEACREIQTAIRAAEVPPDLENSILDAYDELAGGDPPLVSMRSSAAGEDGQASHAGVYYTELNVSRDLLIDTYSMIVASAYSPSAVSYRVERGLTDWEATMAVGCLRMLEPRASGILHSRGFYDGLSDQMFVSATSGVAAWVASGKQEAEEFTVPPGRPPEIASTLLSMPEIERLIEAAQRLEQHFGAPQDVEWAIDHAGELFILQTRPMVVVPPSTEGAGGARVAPNLAPLLEGGFTACPGVGAGAVFAVGSDDDLEKFPDGGVLVARHSSPSFSRVMTRCQAIVTDVGSPIGHMAILAREFGVPTIVGVDGATRTLRAGMTITVDATGGKIYQGEVPALTTSRAERAPLAGSPAVVRLGSIARHVTPLNLVNPDSPEFAPGSCRTLHDITRFIHEKVYHVMFRIGDMAANQGAGHGTLEAELPITVHVFDLGGGVAEGGAVAGRIKPEAILCVPMNAFMQGLTDPRIKWSHPRPLSARGFFSVLGQGVAGPPAEARGVGRASYAVISDQYMNFSTKAGFHFSTVDVFCGSSQNKNYIHFRFAGGAAGEDRRMRRGRFLSDVLSNLDFKVQLRGDHLTARLEKYDGETIKSRLVDLGRLTMCSRQMDMLMDSDDSPGFFAQWFLAGELERF